MIASKRQILDLIWNDPVQLGYWVGFNDLTELHNDWLKKFLYTDEDLTLQAHRGSYKTTTLSLFLSLNTVIRPNETMIFFRKSGGDVVEIMRQVGNVLNSGCMREIVSILYGKELSLTKNSGSEISTNLTTSIKGTSQLVGLGTQTSITGKHADVVITDDIVNVYDRISKNERERTKLFYQELQNIKNRGGRIINTGTPWHEDDAFQLMPDPLKYDCYSTGLIDEKELANIKSKMLPSLFSANYELRHIASENIIFRDPTTGGDASMLEQARWVHIDAAYGGIDSTAFTIAKKVDDKIYVFGKLWHKHVEDVLDDIIAYRRKFNAGKIRCEHNSDKGYLAKQLRAKGERAITYYESMNKFLKITTYLRSVWNDIIFVEGTDNDYIQEILDYNEEAEHDDAPDSLACLMRDMYGKNGDDDRYTPRFMM